MSGARSVSRLVSEGKEGGQREGRKRVGEGRSGLGRLGGVRDCVRGGGEGTEGREGESMGERERKIRFAIIVIYLPGAFRFFSL